MSSTLGTVGQLLGKMAMSTRALQDATRQPSPSAGLPMITTKERKHAEFVETNHVLDKLRPTSDGLMADFDKVEKAALTPEAAVVLPSRFFQALIQGRGTIEIARQT